MYGKKNLYICGNSKCPANSVLGSMYETFAVELVIDLETEKVIDASCILITELGRNFVKNLLVGKNFNTEFNIILNDVELYYQGLPQKALISALKVAHNKYKQYKQKNTDEQLTNQDRFVS